MDTDGPSWNGGWQAQRDLNPQPLVLETSALPVELCAYSGVPEIVAPGPHRRNHRQYSAGHVFGAQARRDLADCHNVPGPQVCA